MSKVEVANPLKKNFVDRRRSSLIDHVNRIRTANSKRQFNPYWKNKNDQNSKDFTGSEASMTESFSEFTNRSQHHKCRASFDFLENVYAYEPKMKSAKRVTLTPNISLDSVKPSGKTNVSYKNNSLHQSKMESKHRKNLEGQLKSSTEKTKKNIRTKQNHKLPSVKVNRVTKLKTKQQNKEEEIDENYVLQKRMWDSKQNPYDLANFGNSMKAVNNSKDIIVLQWLHNLECPGLVKRNTDENKSKFEESKTPIRVLKRPLDTSISQNVKTEPRKPSTSAKRKSRTKSLIHSLGEINVEKNIRDAKRKYVTTSKMDKSSSNESTDYSVSDEGNTKVSNTDSNDEISEKESKEQMKTSGENCRNLPEIEMYVSDLKKLQIIMDLKSLSPDDAAVIIWFDDLPETFWKPNLRRRLSISSVSDIVSPKPSKTAIKSSSVQQLEDTPSPRPDIYFPSVTILKNLVADSKVGSKSLDDDFLNSIYYKRCNLQHINDD